MIKTKDTHVAEWVSDDEFGLVPLKEYERLTKNRSKNKWLAKQALAKQAHGDEKETKVVKKNTPIITKVKSETPMAEPARPATFIRDMNDLRLTARRRIEEIKQALAASAPPTENTNG